MIPVTVLVQTKNEEQSIAACVAALTDFARVIVVDSNSTDSTKALAAAAGATVVNFSWNGFYPKKKQWQLDNLEFETDWVLFLDADERPTATFIKELPELLQAANHSGTNAFDLQLRYVFDGRSLRHGHRVEKRALFRVGKVEFREVDDLDAPGMGELEGHYQPATRGKVARVKDALLHEDKDPVRTWFDRHNKYSDWESYLRTHQTTRRTIAGARSRQGQLFERIPGKPLVFFAYTYIGRAGILDGTPGFNYAVALSSYYWQISLKSREALRNEAARERTAGTAKPIRILQFINTLSRADGGPARNAYELHEAFNSRKDSAAVIAVFAKNAAPETVASATSARFRGGALGHRIPLLNLAALMSQADCVVIHGYYLPWAPIIAAIAKGLKKQVLLTPHGSLTEYQQQFSQVRKAAFDRTGGAVLQWAVSKFAVGSEREAQELLRKFPDARVVVVGVGTRNFTHDLNHVPSTQGVTRLLSISRISQKKRIDLIIRAVADLANDTEVLLRVAGDGNNNLLLELQELTKRLGIADKVEFIGDADEDTKKYLYQHSDVFVAPSDDENFGISVAEALGNGLACVVSAHVASGHGLSGSAGTVVAEQSPQLIAKAIRSLIEVPQQEREVQAMQFAASRFSWEKVAAAWIAAVEKPR